MEISAVLPTACAAIVNQEVRIGRFSHKAAQRTQSERRVKSIDLSIPD
jgi:hypothetical protein